MYHFLKITLALAFRSSMLDVFIWLLGEEWLPRNIHYIPKNQRILPRSKFCILLIDMDSAVTKKITRNVILNSTSVYIGNPLWSQLSYSVFVKWYFFQISYRALKANKLLTFIILILPLMKILFNKTNLLFYSPVYITVDRAYRGLNEKCKRLLDLKTWM